MLTSVQQSFSCTVRLFVPSCMRGPADCDHCSCNHALLEWTRCICICVYIYIYILISKLPRLDPVHRRPSLWINIYIYIYIYMFADNVLKGELRLQMKIAMRKVVDEQLTTNEDHPSSKVNKVLTTCWKVSCGYRWRSPCVRIRHGPGGRAPLHVLHCHVKL